jgi:hypothetical protein
MSLFGSLFKHETVTTNITNVLDLVTYMASLVSNPDDIGSSLDTVRDITARLSPGESLPVDDINQLLGVYLNLETYLTTKEPLRSFTKDDLRKRIPESLLRQLTNYKTTTQAVMQV